MITRRTRRKISSSRYSIGKLQPVEITSHHGSAPRFLLVHQSGISDGSETALGVSFSWTRGPFVAWMSRRRRFPGPEGSETPSVWRIPKERPTPSVVAFASYRSLTYPAVMSRHFKSWSNVSDQVSTDPRFVGFNDGSQGTPQWILVRPFCP